MTISQVSDTVNPLVSVIIPTYNRISMLEEALASVAAQDFDGVVEIIVVDDNSQDGTSEILMQKYQNVRLIKLEQNEGNYAARNRALVVAKGKYIAFLDDDDLWQKNYLKSQITALTGKERCFGVSDLMIWDIVENQKRIKLQRPNLARYNSPIHHLLVGWNFIATLSSVIFPRQIFDEVGLFDENFRVGGDNDFITRCLIAGYQPLLIELPLAIWRKHGGDQLSNNIKTLELRKQGRIERVNKLYPLLEKRNDLPPVQRLRAEIYSFFASVYFQDKYYLHWLTSSLESAYNASPGYALFSMMRDLKRFIQKFIKSLLVA